ncbi:MAG: hypothetical protein IIC53_02005 [Proteobacteria bacterium]|nr:hypothetical protein [Pseudomonadota bacterium]
MREPIDTESASIPNMDVEAWLHNLGVGHYAQAFADNGIDNRKLRGLTSQELKALGVTALSHRKTILRAIFELKTGKKDIRLPADELPP